MLMQPAYGPVFCVRAICFPDGRLLNSVLYAGASSWFFSKVN
jgi:hypothetical protein